MTSKTVRLRFVPQQPHYLLDIGKKRKLTAGETFEADEKDVEQLLASPDIELATPVPSEDASQDAESDAAGSGDEDATSAPEGAEKASRKRA